jgi:uncharacterized protein YjbJ (UPF0337 family)
MPRRDVITEVSGRDFVTEESIMKARNNNDEVKGKFHEVKGESNGKVRKLTDDPTLEGKDENKVGRVQRRIGSAEKAIEK